MGRVYDALKRAESAPRTFKPTQSSVSRNGNSDNVSYFVQKHDHEHPWEGSPFTAMPAAFNSASTAHTAEGTGGPALPGGPASREAGATFDAVGSTPAVGVGSRKVLVAPGQPPPFPLTHPPSPHPQPSPPPPTPPFQP